MWEHTCHLKKQSSGNNLGCGSSPSIMLEAGSFCGLSVSSTRLFALQPGNSPVSTSNLLQEEWLYRYSFSVPSFFVESEDSDSGILEGLVGGKTGRNAVIVISEMYKKLKTYKSDPCPFAAVLYACWPSSPPWLVLVFNPKLLLLVYHSIMSWLSHVQSSNMLFSDIIWQ